MIHCDPELDGLCMEVRYLLQAWKTKSSLFSEDSAVQYGLSNGLTVFTIGSILPCTMVLAIFVPRQSYLKICLNIGGVTSNIYRVTQLSSLSSFWGQLNLDSSIIELLRNEKMPVPAHE